MRQWKPRGQRGGAESHDAHGYRHTGVQQYQRGPEPKCNDRYLRRWRHANRIGGSLQWELHLLVHDAELRLGDRYDCGGGTGGRV